MSLTDTLAADRIQALTRIRRRLLADPLLHRANEPELWPAVLRYGADLAHWFAVNLGWRLVIDPAGGFARLHKVAARPDPTRPARLNDTPLTPRKYTSLFLACAALDEQPRQTTLSVLSENVAELSAAEDPIPTFDPSNSHSDRVAFAGATKWLAANRIIAVRDGNLDDYATDPTADALLDVNDRLLAHLSGAVAVSPSIQPLFRAQHDPDRLPTPTRPRYTLLRIGIQNVWEYDVTTRFVARDGRLLLRGQNESGKTKAVEVSLPAVLDAILRAERLDPFGEQARAMRENLIGPHTDEDATVVAGYVWAEFGRLDEHGQPR